MAVLAKIAITTVTYALCIILEFRTFPKAPTLFVRIVRFGRKATFKPSRYR